MTDSSHVACDGSFARRRSLPRPGMGTGPSPCLVLACATRARGGSARRSTRGLRLASPPSSRGPRARSGAVPHPVQAGSGSVSCSRGVARGHALDPLVRSPDTAEAASSLAARGSLAPPSRPVVHCHALFPKEIRSTGSVPHHLAFRSLPRSSPFDRSVPAPHSKIAARAVPPDLVVVARGPLCGSATARCRSTRRSPGSCPQPSLLGIARDG